MQELSIRPYRSDDYNDVIALFDSGIRSLSNVYAWQLTGNVYVWGSCVAIIAMTYIIGAPWPALYAVASIMACATVAVCLYVRFFIVNVYIQRSMKDDLADIPTAYNPSQASQFWVAELAINGAKPTLVGCVGLQRKTQHTAELRRMSVKQELRRAGVGISLAKHLIAYAKQQGYQEVVLTTSTLQPPAIRLYEKLGWQEVDRFYYYKWLAYTLAWPKFVLRLDGERAGTANHGS